MKVNELRIGNVIMLDSELEGIITEIRSNNCKVIYYGEVNGEVEQRFSLIPFERIFPSPINDQWFIDFKFKGNQFSISKGNFRYDKKNKILTWYGIHLLDSLWNEVHKLQNLHFALTGQELTIK